MFRTVGTSPGRKAAPSSQVRTSTIRSPKARNVAPSAFLCGSGKGSPAAAIAPDTHAQNQSSQPVRTLADAGEPRIVRDATKRQMFVWRFRRAAARSRAGPVETRVAAARTTSSHPVVRSLFICDSFPLRPPQCEPPIHSPFPYTFRRTWTTGSTFAQTARRWGMSSYHIDIHGRQAASSKGRLSAGHFRQGT